MEGTYFTSFAGLGDMSRIPASFGDFRREPTFADLCADAIGGSSIKEVAHRWRIPEETLRGYRDGKATPRLDRVCKISFSDEERLRILKLIAAGRFDCTPREGIEPEATLTPATMRAAGIQLISKSVDVAEEIDRATADGVLDQAESERIERGLSEVGQQTKRLRPRNLLQRFRRFLSRAHGAAQS